jgi:hypothetical protein
MPLSKRKCGNNPFWINNFTGERKDKLSVTDKNAQVWSHWDSELEWKVYQQLRKTYSADAIARQVELVVIPASDHFPKVIWTVDFAVTVIKAGCIVDTIYIEAKGRWIIQNSDALTGFCRLIKALAYYNPSAYERLHIVSDFTLNLGTGITAQDYRQLFKEVK